MKRYEKITIPVGTIGYESKTGYNNWWYNDLESPRKFPISAKVEHLHLWKNQDPYFVFKVPLCVFKPEEVFEKPQYITIWLHKEQIDEIINSQNA